MSPHALENLYQRLHRPKWFWPAVYVILFIMFCLGSLEGGAP